MTIVNSDQLENRSEVIARYSSRAVKTAMYAWFLGTFVFRYSARDLEKMFWLRTGFSRKDLCVEYAVSVHTGKNLVEGLGDPCPVVIPFFHCRYSICRRQRLASISNTSAKIS